MKKNGEDRVMISGPLDFKEEYLCMTKHLKKESKAH